jgi:hypothetical protein
VKFVVFTVWGFGGLALRLLCHWCIGLGLLDPDLIIFSRLSSNTNHIQNQITILTFLSDVMSVSSSVSFTPFFVLCCIVGFHGLDILASPDLKFIMKL